MCLSEDLSEIEDQRGDAAAAAERSSFVTQGESALAAMLLANVPSTSEEVIALGHKLFEAGRSLVSMGMLGHFAMLDESSPGRVRDAAQPAADDFFLAIGEAARDEIRRLQAVRDA